MDLSALRHVLDEIPEAALADVDVKFVPCHDILIFSDSLGDAFSRLVGILFLVLVCRLCWLCVPEELHIHIKTPFISIYMHVGCNYIMSVWEMQTHVHQVWVLKWLNWIACWFVVKAISWHWWHTGPLVAFWVFLVRCFTNSIFVYEPAHVGPARMNHVSFALEFKSTVQHFINVSDRVDGWSLPLNYI